jgi:putative phosphoesterase
LRVAVLSDTHVSTRAANLPGRVYEVCCEADLVLHCGDFVEAEVYRDLQRFAPVRGVLGNMDGGDLEAMLPEEEVFTLEGMTVCMTHGSGPVFGLEDRVIRRFAERKPRIVLFGHSHRYAEREENGVLLLNPGAVAAPPGGRSMAVLTLVSGEAPKVERVLF